MTGPSVLQLPAYAKVNLSLSVGAPEGPRGYHPIASWFVAVDLKDDVTLERLPAGPSRADLGWAPDAPRPTPIDWPTETDLGVRAHRLLERHAGRELPVALRVRKRIPVGGGLGGGSSDAAAVLVGANEVFDLGLTLEELLGLSAGLGSDVAFFVDDSPPRPAVVTGFGEAIERLMPVPAGEGTGVVLILPPFGCPTGPVYAAFDRSEAGRGARADAHRVRGMVAVAALGAGIDARELFNDLEGAACDAEPRLRAALDGLRAALGPACPVHVTGSGSTMFALAAPGAETERLAARVRAARPDCAAVATRLL